MSHARNAVAAVIALVLVIVLSFAWTTSTPEPAVAEEVGCIVQLEGTIGLVICGGEIVDQLQLPTVQVTETVLEQIIKEVDIVGPTIRIVGPTKTITVRVTEATTAPVETVTAPGETSTVTAEPSVEIVTETVTASPTRQRAPVDDRVVPDNDEEPALIDFGDGETTVIEAGLGALTIVAMMILVLLALYGGYALGWKNKEREETLFMAALLDKAKARRRK